MPQRYFWENLITHNEGLSDTESTKLIIKLNNGWFLFPLREIVCYSIKNALISDD